MCELGHIHRITAAAPEVPFAFRMTSPLRAATWIMTKRYVSNIPGGQMDHSDLSRDGYVMWEGTSLNT